MHDKTHTGTCSSVSLHDYILETYAICETSRLMEVFLKRLSGIFDFDFGAYVIERASQTEGMIVCKSGLEPRMKEFSTAFLESAAEFCNVPCGLLKTELEVKKLNGLAGPLCGISGAIEFPLYFKGRPAGMVQLVFLSGSRPDARIAYHLLQHTNMALESILFREELFEERLKAILGGIEDGIYLVDGRGRIQALNPKGLALTSWFCGEGKACAKAAQGAPLADCECVFAKTLRRRLGAQDIEKKIYRDEFSTRQGGVLSICLQKTGEEKDSDYLVTARDITEYSRMQKSFLERSKLEAMGESLAHLSHEIKNPLQTLLTNIELLEGGFDEKWEKRVETIKGIVIRINKIVRDLLMFARDTNANKEVFDVNEALAKGFDMFLPQFSLSNINFRRNLHPKPLEVRCNKNLFVQVILNLLQNAKEAIEDSKQGSFVSVDSYQGEDGAVIVEVADNGPGIPHEMLERIFEPFFTTKSLGKGTGLGLSISRKIIEAMGATLCVIPSDDRKIFRISMPGNSNAEKSMSGTGRMQGAI